MAATIKMNPINTTAFEGDTQVTLKCQIEGYPLPIVVWYKGDQFIDLDKVSITETIDTFVLESVLTFQSVDRTDSDVYLCSGSNVLNITEREMVEVNSTAVLLEIYCELYCVYCNYLIGIDLFHSVTVCYTCQYQTLLTMNYKHISVSINL